MVDAGSAASPESGIFVVADGELLEPQAASEIAPTPREIPMRNVVRDQARWCRWVCCLALNIIVGPLA
jgi:hypothetical protein